MIIIEVLTSESSLQLTISVATIIMFVDFLINKTPKAKEWYENIIGKLNTRLHKWYYKGLESKDYITWRDSQLKQIYGEQHFTEVYNKLYPAFIIPFAEHYCYQDLIEGKLYSPSDLQFERNNESNTPFEIENESVKFLPFEQTAIMTSGSNDDVRLKKKLLRKYRCIVKQSVKHPDIIGYCLDHYGINNAGRITHIYPKLGTYGYNVYSSHILEYELFMAYKKLKGNKEVSMDELWKYLPFRRYIHFGEYSINHAQQALFTGIRRYAEFSVQCLVMFSDGRTLLLQRSINNDKVAIKPGYFQFLPAGGFELFEKEKFQNIRSIEDNYSPELTVFRELLEEVMGLNEFKYINSTDEYKTVYTLLNNLTINDILSMIEKGEADFNMLGVAVDLVTLRHELSFILKFKSKTHWERDIEPNDEFEDSNRPRKSREEVEDLLKSDAKFNPASALMYKMFMESPFYNEYKVVGPKDND